MILEDTEQIETSHLPSSIRQETKEAPLRADSKGNGLQVALGAMTLEEIERQAISLALDKANHNQVKAARLLGISRDTLRYRMKKLGLVATAHPD